MVTLKSITKDELEWTRSLRNRNKQHFIDNKIILRKQQENWYKTLDYPFFVIEYDKKNVGTIAVKKIHGRIEIHNVIIDKQYRRKGILKQAITLIKKKYGAPLYVDVLAKNRKAIAAYEKIGFSQYSYRLKKES